MFSFYKQIIKERKMFTNQKFSYLQKISFDTPDALKMVRRLGS